MTVRKRLVPVKKWITTLVEGPFQLRLDRKSGRVDFSGTKPGRDLVQNRMRARLRHNIAKTHSEIHIHAFRLRLDGLFRYKLNGRIDLACETTEIYADARAVA